MPKIYTGPVIRLRDAREHIKDLEQQLERAFKEGYHRGHDHTVEGCFQWCDEGTNDVYQDWLKE